MIAYKGFTKDLSARLGRGMYQFEVGKTFTEESSKTVRNGFHCCENPFECLGYYPLQSDNRYFQVEAAGSIDEDGQERIACTELTLLKELSIKELAGYGMAYIIQHPMRDKWQQSRRGILVTENEAEGLSKDYIAIARGAHPKVKGVEGAVLGVILEPERGRITSAKLFVVLQQQAGKWYTIDENRQLKEVNGEKEGD
ncbi:MAG: hypothetical protein IJ335_06480 [Lachnospiraceae bacterium]|nr:hypothetical protein [Lachnospiraceae bacterium]